MWPLILGVLQEFEAMRANPFWTRDQAIGETYRGNAIGDAVVLYNDATDDRDVILERLDYLQNNTQVRGCWQTGNLPPLDGGVS
jgi:hypothetical protein